MSLKAIVQQLRSLPYTEMKALAEIVRGKIPDHPTDAAIADALSSLPEINNKELDLENRYLAEIFHKKRAITITTGNAGKGPWTVSMQGGGVSVTSATIRGALSEFLDALAAHQALVGKK